MPLCAYFKSIICKAKLFHRRLAYQINQIGLTQLRREPVLRGAATPSASTRTCTGWAPRWQENGITIYKHLALYKPLGLFKTYTLWVYLVPCAGIVLHYRLCSIFLTCTRQYNSLFFLSGYKVVRPYVWFLV